MSSLQASEPSLDPQSAKSLLAQIENYAQYLKGDLAGASALTEEESAAINEMNAAIDLGVKLPPQVMALPITKQIYRKKTHHDMPVDLAASFASYAFYYVQVPINLFPRRGMRSSEIEIRLAYLGESGLDKPTTYDMFPERKWLDLVDWKENLEFTLDEDLHFNVQTPGVGQALLLLGSSLGVVAPGQGERLLSPEIADMLGKMGVDIGAKINTGLKGGAAFKFGPFHYLIRRAIITSDGRGNDIAVWRFSGRDELQGNEELHVAIVLQVPRALATLRIVPIVRVNFSADSLRTRLNALIELLKNRLKDLKGFFGDEVEHQIKSFEDEVGRGWQIKLGGKKGDVVWDLSDQLMS